MPGGGSFSGRAAWERPLDSILKRVTLCALFQRVPGPKIRQVIKPGLFVVALVPAHLVLGGRRFTGWHASAGFQAGDVPVEGIRVGRTGRILGLLPRPRFRLIGVRGVSLRMVRAHLPAVLCGIDASEALTPPGPPSNCKHVDESGNSGG